MAWKVIQVILERRLEMCDQPMDTVRPRCTRVKPGKGAHSGNYYKLPQIGRMGAIEELRVELGTRYAVRNTGDGGKKRNRGCGVCAAYKSYNIPGALEVAVAPREGWRILTPSIRLARGLIPPRRRSLHKVP